MSLKPPTDRQMKLLIVWADARWGGLYAWLREYDNGEKPDWSPGIVESDVARYLETTRQAGIAILSGLVRNGWLQTDGCTGDVVWELTDEALENISFFVTTV